MKYIIVTGGVVSGLGKGITASSIGLILKSMGFSVTAIKIDPYINIDAGNMSPYEHGEVYVLDDGGETDLDLGNYERFLDISLTSDNNLTTGKVYLKVINRERNREYSGKTVQVVPHITDYIKEHIHRVAHQELPGNGKVPDVCIIEVGGTVGDIEGLPFAEALVQMMEDLPDNDYCFIHVSLIVMNGSEAKTKPTQHSWKTVREKGITPDFLCLRIPSIPRGSGGEEKEDDALKRKLKNTCHIGIDKIIYNPDVNNIYEVPDVFIKQKFHLGVCTKLNLVAPRDHSFPRYYEILKHFRFPPKKTVTIGIVGKYTKLQDTYLSLIRALEHASVAIQHKLVIKWIPSENFNEETLRVAGGVDGLLIPGGFGCRGIEGMISAAQFARETGIPLFGICLGMQIMLIEIARNLMNWNHANSTEFDSNTPHPVINMSSDKQMRLGSYQYKLSATSLLEYAQENSLKVEKSIISQDRHRHRYEVNNSLFREMLLKGIVECGGESINNEQKHIIEIIERDEKGGGSRGWWKGCQFHPEYKSRNNNAHWLFISFLKRCALFAEKK